jgi:hypothetical protein
MQYLPLPDNLGAVPCSGCDTCAMFMHQLACVILLLLLCVTAKARAESSCLQIQTNYDLVKADAVSVQTIGALRGSRQRLRRFGAQADCRRAPAVPFVGAI